MGIKVTGTIHKVFDTKQVSDKFSKREFVVEIADNPKYPQLVMFEVTKDRTSMLDGMGVGDQVSIEFNLRGREWRSPSGDVKYFNTLDCWKVERTGATRVGHQAGGSSFADPDGAVPAIPQDDIPFASCSLTAEPSPIARVLR